jgi:hypothetical protein
VRVAAVPKTGADPAVAAESTIAAENNIAAKKKTGDATPQPEVSKTPDAVAGMSPEDRSEAVRNVLGLYKPKMLNTQQHGPWETMHGIIGFGVSTNVRHGGPSGEPVTAIPELP